MLFLFILRGIGLVGVFPDHAFDSFFVPGEFTVGKDTDDQDEKKNDNEVCHFVLNAFSFVIGSDRVDIHYCNILHILSFPFAGLPPGEFVQHDTSVKQRKILSSASRLRRPDKPE
jgi:hypothetical protein